MKVTFREAQEIMELVNAKLTGMTNDKEWNERWAKEHDEQWEEDSEDKIKRQILESIKHKFDTTEF